MMWHLFRLHSRRKAVRSAKKRLKAVRLEFERLEERRVLSNSNLLPDVVEPAEMNEEIIGSTNPGVDESPVQDQLQLEETRAIFRAVSNTVHQGQLPSDQQFGDFITAGVGLLQEIDRVMKEDPGNQRLIELGRAHTEFAATLDDLLLVRRLTDLAAGKSVGGGGSQGEERPSLDGNVALIREIYMGLFQGKLPTEDQLAAFMRIGLLQGEEIQRVANEDPGSQYLVELGWAQLDFAITFESVLLAQRVAEAVGGISAPDDSPPGESNQGQPRLPLDEYGQFFFQLHEGLYRGELPTDDQLLELIGRGQLLWQEIQRVASEDPASHYLVELGWTQGGYAYYLNKVLLALRVSGRIDDPGTNADAGLGQEPVRLDDYRAINAGLYQGELPSGEQINALVETGQGLSQEIQRVASENPRSHSLIELARAQAELASIFTNVLLAGRVAERALVPGPNQGQPPPNDGEIPPGDMDNGSQGELPPNEGPGEDTSPPQEPDQSNAELANALNAVLDSNG